MDPAQESKATGAVAPAELEMSRETEHSSSRAGHPELAVPPHLLANVWEDDDKVIREYLFENAALVEARVNVS